MSNLDDAMCDILRMTRDHEDAPDMAHGLKLAEECGEVAEAIMKGNGYLGHKTLKEDVLHEVADVFNTCCALLTSHYPDYTPDELLEHLTVAVKKKGKKYAKVLGVEKKVPPRDEELQGVLDNVLDAVADLEAGENDAGFARLVEVLHDHNMDGP